MPRRRISGIDFTFPTLEHDKVLQLMKLLDVDAVDIGFFDGRTHLQPSQVADDPAGHGRRLKTRLDQLGLGVSDVFFHPAAGHHAGTANTPDADEQRKHRQLFQVAITFALTVGSKHITGLPGMAHGDLDSDLARASAEAAWRAEAARNAGLIYSVEPHVESLILTPELTRRFLAKAGGTTLTLDPAHWICAGFSNADWQQFIPQASHVHLRAAARNRLQTSLDENHVDFAALMHGLDAAHYQGWSTLEYVWVDWKGCNQCDNVGESLRLRDLVRAVG